MSKANDTVNLLLDEEGMFDNMTIEERIDKLGQEIMANSFIFIDRAKKSGKRATAKEIRMQEELQRQFKYIVSVYQTLKKTNRISNNPGNNTAFEKDLLSRIKEKSGSIGSIVQKLPTQ